MSKVTVFLGFCLCILVGCASSPESLIEDLKSPDPSTRIHAVRELRGLILKKAIEPHTMAKAVEPLIMALQDQSYDVRWMSACALGDIGDCKAVPALIKAARENDKTGIGDFALAALGGVRDKRALEYLIQGAKSNDSKWNNAIAIPAIGQIGDESHIPLILSLMKGAHPQILESCADALGWIGTAKCVPHIVELLNSQYVSVQNGAARAMGRVKNKAALLADRQIIESLILLVRKDGFAAYEASESLKAITGKDFGKDRNKWMAWHYGKAQAK